MDTLITFETPDKLSLQGIWLGAPRAKTVYIFVHGLYSNLFSQSATAQLLSEAPQTASFLFNNRGNGYVSKLRQITKKKLAPAIVGGSHEVFHDARYDIAGAVAFAKSRGAQRIVLVGHSTGCQKAVWYLAGKPAREVHSAVLLAPLSDYSGVKEQFGARYAQIKRTAEALVKAGTPHTLLPARLSPVPCDAQRWLSLYTPESDEEIFTYASGKSPKTLRKVKAPLLALFASSDEYADRPAEELAQWFRNARPKSPIDAYVVEAPNHGFSGAAELLAKIVRTWAQD